MAADVVLGTTTYVHKSVWTLTREQGVLSEVLPEGVTPLEEVEEVPVGLDDRPGSRLHRLQDPRERGDIEIDRASLPKLPPGLLAYISLPVG